MLEYIGSMHRRRFLVGLGAFAGAALIVPRFPTIFDMGRTVPTGPWVHVDLPQSMWDKRSAMAHDDCLFPSLKLLPVDVRTMYPAWVDGNLTTVQITYLSHGILSADGNWRVTDF